MKLIRIYFEKMCGGKTCPPRAPWPEIVLSAIGGFAGIAAIYVIGHYHKLHLEDTLFLVGSFGASAVLVYGAPNSPFSQPRNLVGGHVLSAVVGVSCALLLPGQIALAASAAVALSILIMHISRTIHPPGGATALIAVIGGNNVHDLQFWYVLTPIGTGAVIMLIIALLINNLSPYRRYPQFWL